MKHAGRPIGAGTVYYLSRTSTSYGRGEQNDYSMNITAFDLSQPFWHNVQASMHQWWHEGHMKEYEPCISISRGSSKDSFHPRIKPGEKQIKQKVTPNTQHSAIS